jgi:hypothetical protein
VVNKGHSDLVTAHQGAPCAPPAHGALLIDSRP